MGLLRRETVRILSSPTLLTLVRTIVRKDLVFHSQCCHYMAHYYGYFITDYVLVVYFPESNRIPTRLVDINYRISTRGGKSSLTGV